QTRVEMAGRTLAVDYPFMLGEEAGEPAVLTVNEGAYTLLVEGQSAYPIRLEQRLAYRLQVLDEAGRPLAPAQEDVTSTIVGQGYEQVLPPTGRDGEWLTFTMRLPYKAKIATGLLFAVAVLWVTELVPLAAAALLIPVVVVVAGIASPDTVLQPFFDPIVVLFFAGFLLAEAMRR